MNNIYLIPFFLLLFVSQQIHGQSGNCDPATPFYTVDMTGVSDSVFTQVNASKIRNQSCCGSSEDCIEFEVTLDPGAVGLSFEAQGPGGGSLDYQINCGGTSYSSGDTACLSPTGPFTVTFCKNGTNAYDYIITSIPGFNINISGTTFCTNDSLSYHVIATPDVPGTTYTYSWYDAYDGGSSVLSTDTFLNIPATGSYSVVLENLNAGTCVKDTLNFDGTIYLNPTGEINGNLSICEDEAASLSATDAGAGHTYAWNFGSRATPTAATGTNPPTVAFDTAGLYNVYLTVTETSTACLTIDTASLEVYDTPDLDTLITNASCEASADGAIDVTLDGGKTPFIYLWDTGATTQDLENLTAGDYTLTVTDDNGCDVTATFTVTEPAAIAISATTTDLTCNGGNTGSISGMGVSGGNAAYNYTWNDINPIARWTFENTIDDVTGNGNNNTSLSGSISYSSDAVERNSAIGFDGSTKIGYSVNGGFMDQTFTEKTILMWVKPGALTGVQVLYEEGNTNSGIALQLNAGTIEAAVREGFSQANAGTLPFPGDGNWHHLALVFNNGDLTIYLDGVAGTTTTTGFASISASGSDGGLGATLTSNAFGSSSDDFYAGRMDDVHYLDLALSGAQIANVFANDGNRNQLSAGTYFLTVTDANDCTQTETFVINEPPALLLSLDSTDISCFGADDGSIDLTISGGTPGYFYAWSGGAGSGQDPSGLAPDRYTVTVTDGNGCTIVDSIQINEPLVIDLSVVIDSIKCFGASDGAIDLTVAGGTSPFSFSWNNGAGSGEDPTSLAQNTYTVTVTDANLCTGTLAVDVVAVPAMTVVDSLNTTSCFGGSDGSIFLTVSSGNPPYQFNWGNGWVSQSDTTGLMPGNYAVSINDSEGCQTIENYTVGEATEINITPSVSGVSCNGGEDGSVISVGVTGGTPDYTFEWLDVKPEAHWTFEETLDDISGNDHNYTADSEGIFYISSDAQERDYSMYFDGATRIAYDEPLGGFMDAAFTQRTISMWIKPEVFSGKQTLFEEGGGFYGIAFRLQGDQIRAGVTESPIFDRVLESPSLPAVGQWYHIAVVYNNSDFYLYVDGIEVDYMDTGLGEIPSTESKGGIGGNFGYDAIADGWFGEGDFFYTGRMDDVRYYETALDSMQVVDEMRNDGTRNALSANDYTVIVHDANGCTKSETISIVQPSALSLSISGNDVSCNGATDGTAKATISGGVSPYTYSWDSGQTTDSISNLSGGTYYLTVTDDNTCTVVDSVTINEPNSISITTQITSNFFGQDVSCVGATDGVATATATGGNGTYSYAWSAGTAAGNTVSDIGAGTYGVTVTDVLGCTGVGSVTLSNPDQMTLSIAETNAVSCNGDGDGAAEATVSNGNSPYTYSWENGQSGKDLINVTTGTYSVTVRDVLGCTVVDSITIAEPSSLSLSVDINTDYNSYDISCAGGSDGVAIANPSGGTSPYSYQWSVAGETNQTLTGRSAGSYLVTVTDAADCTITGAVTLSDPPVLSATFSTSDPSDCGLNDGNITVNASGGVGNYEYRLSTGSWQSTNSFTNLAPGVYYIYIKTSPGTCEVGPYTEILSLPESPSFDNITLINPSTNASSDGAILITASGSGVQINYQLLDNSGAVLVPWQEDYLFSGLVEESYTLQLKYYNQSCISSLDVSLVGGGGIVGSITGLDFCSGEENSGQFVETYYIPGPEDQLLATLDNIVPTSCGIFSGNYPIDPVSNFISIGIVETGTILYYDHFEIDGYESNLSIPTQSSTEIWGDNNPSNGIPPGYATDLLIAGQNIILENDVVTTTRTTVLDYDGGDKIGSRGNIAITRLAWAAVTETLLAGAVEVYPTALWGTSYVIPVGEDNDVNSMFEYTGAIIMAQENGTSISIDADANGSYETNTTLSEGQSYHINGGINAGARITSSKVTQVHLLTGDRCATFESRFFTLKPTEQWSDSYFSPVSTLAGDPTYIHVYNPNGSSITINWETNLGAQTSFSLASGATAWREIPDGSGGHFFSSGNEPFYAIGTIDSDVTSSSAHDWGFALLPEDQLSSQITTIGFAPGNDPSNPNVCCNGWNWSLDFASSENTASGNNAIFAFDKDPSTFWHTEYSSGSPPSHPHEIEIFLGGTNVFDGFRYIPRQDGSQNGRVANYEFYYWDFGAGAWTLAASGTFANDASYKDIYFPQVTTDAIRFRALSEVNGNVWATVAELELLVEENSAPVWLTAGYPTGSASTGSIQVCIDYNGDGGLSTDANGVTYDLQQTLNEFERIKIYDADGDQTGMRIWVCDGSDALIAGAWGQDPATASGASPAIDLGVGLPNGIPFAAAKCVDLSRDYNGNDLFDECDEVIYSVTIRNSGALPLEVGSVNIIDTLPSEVSYIPNSTVIFQGASITGIPDNGSPASAFPLDEGGMAFGSAIPPGDSAVIRFEASINSVTAAIFITNEAIVTQGPKILEPNVTFPVEEPTDPVIAEIPGDTLISCEALIPAPPFTDTCMLEFFIPQGNMSVHYTDSEEGAYPAALILDGSPVTFWHTEYTTSNPTHPHEIQLDLGADYPVTGFLYTPRQSAANGRIANYEFYVSSDGTTWGSALASGTWTSSSNQEEIDVAQISARYIRLVALSEVSGNPWTSIAELNIKYCATTLTYTENNPGVSCNYDITRTWNITNYCGRTADQVQTITIRDTTAPVLVGIPADLTVAATAVPDPPTITTTDNCDGSPALNYTADTTYTSCAFTITRTWMTTDNCSNSTQASQSIFVDAPMTLSASVTSSYNGSEISCVDASDGVAVATPNGGIAPITYAWSSAHATQSASGLAPGDYTVTATDADNCTATASVTVNPPDSILITLTITSNYNDSTISCFGASDGNLLATASGGTGLLSFAWSNGDSGQNLNNIAAGPYTVTVSDENNCSAEKSIIIYQPPTLTVDPTVVSDFDGFQVSCFGASDGVIAANPAGGTEPYFYMWDNGATTATLTNVSAGKYYLTLTDANNCAALDSVEVSDPPALDLTMSVTSDYNGADVSCNGSSDGSVSVAVSGGNPPYSYAWGTSPVVTVDNLSGISAGIYPVTVTDDNGCEISDSIEVTNPLLLTVGITSVSDFSGFEVSCEDAIDGKIFTSTSGGTGNYSFLWNTGATTDSLVGVGAGNYRLIVSDENNCKDTIDVTLEEPPLLEIADTTLVDPSLCNANDGSITILATGGIGTYEYRINTDAWQDTSNVYNNLPAGNYDVYTRDSAGNCEAGPLALTLVNPIPRACPITPPADPLIVCTTNVSVEFSVSAPVDATGFTWTVPAGATIVSGQGTDTIVVDMTGIAAGTHSVCVVTESDCGSSASCCFSYQTIICNEVCDNGVDDDEDGLMDCDDPDCVVIAEINLSDSIVCIHETVSISADDAGAGATYQWDFGGGANPATAMGLGPHSVAYNSCGNKNISLLVSKEGCNEIANASLLVQDTIKPVWITPPTDLTLECDGSTDPGGAIATWLGNDGNGAATDNCGAVTITYSYPGLTADCGFSGDADVTFTATDECGNDSSLVVTITIVDNTIPVFVSGIPNDTTVECSGVPSPPALATIVTQDVCSNTISLSYNEVRVDSSCTHLYRLVRTWTATDDCSNSATAQQHIIVQDTSDPSLLGVPLDTLIDCDDIPAVPAIGTDITSTDNCDPDVDIVYSEAVIYHPTADWKSSASCSLLYAISDLTCNDNGTPSNASDDTVVFGLTVVGQNTGTNWSATINGNAVSGEYYQVYTLGEYPATGPINFTLADSIDPSCTINVTIDPSTCD